MANLNGKYQNFKKEVVLFETKVVLPDPPNFNQVINHNVPQSKQKWSRDLFSLPPCWNEQYLIRQAEEKHTTGKTTNYNWWMDNPTMEMREFAEADWERRINGVWIFINGKLQYLTGKHYLYLQWYQMADGYPDYLDRDRRFWYVWKHVEEDPASMGLIYEKHRRDGASYRYGIIAIDYATVNPNSHCGMQNKVGKDANRLFQQVVVKPFQKFPAFYKPTQKGTDAAARGLYFDNPPRRITKDRSFIQSSEALGSRITFENTVANAYDGDFMHRYLLDEGAKMVEMDLLDAWEVTKRCLTIRGQQTGKAYLPSTILEDSEGEKNNQAIENFRMLWEQSSPASKMRDGKTVSGLTRYFCPAYDGLRYENTQFFNEFGESLVDEAKSFLEEKMDFLKRNGHVKSLRYLKTQYPFNPEDPFLAQAGGSALDQDKLLNCKEWLESKNVANRPNWTDLVVEGDLDWIEQFGGEVRFRPNPGKGRFLLKQSVITKIQANQVRREKYGEGFIYTPMNRHRVVIGIDPVAFDLDDLSTAGHYSHAAALAMWLPDKIVDGGKPLPGQDGFDPEAWESGGFFMLYHARPNKTDHFYEDMAKMSIFLGAEMTIERNSHGIIKYLREKGFGAMISKPSNQVYSLSQNKNQNTQGNWASQDLHRTAFELWQAWIYDWGVPKHLPFPILVNQLLKFTFKNITVLDLYAAGEQALLASARYKSDPGNIMQRNNLIKFEVPTYKIAR